MAHLCVLYSAHFAVLYGSPSHVSAISGITALPETLAQYPGLKLLECGMCKLDSQWPLELSVWTELRQIGLANNRLYRLPEVFVYYTRLERLALDGNFFSELDEAFLPPSISFLSLAHNPLSYMPSLGRFENLHYLNLSHCKFEIFPKAVCEAANLETLMLDKNTISYLPDEITFLTGLKTLSMESNFLKRIPDEIGALVSLTKLYVQDNLIQSVSANLGDLQLVKELDFSDNRLAALPFSLARLKDLECCIRIKTNEMSEWPPNLRGRKIVDNEIYEYLRLGEAYVPPDPPSEEPESHASEIEPEGKCQCCMQ